MKLIFFVVLFVQMNVWASMDKPSHQSNLKPINCPLEKEVIGGGLYCEVEFQADNQRPTGPIELQYEPGLGFSLTEVLIALDEKTTALLSAELDERSVSDGLLIYRQGSWKQVQNTEFFELLEYKMQLYYFCEDNRGIFSAQFDSKIDSYPISVKIHCSVDY